MAFSIRLYKMTCEKKRVDKTDYLTNRTEYNGTFKSATSLTSPSFILETPNGISDIQGFNYFYIFQLHRYYFITDLISISDKLTQVNGRVDVLMSFRNKFMNLNAMIDRNENDFNPLLDDKNIPYRVDLDVREEELSFYATPQESSLVNTTFSTDNVGLKASLSVIHTTDEIHYHSDGTTDALPFPQYDISSPTGSGLPTISKFRGTKGNTFIYAVDVATAENLLVNLVREDYSNLASFVKSVRLYPFELEVNDIEYHELSLIFGANTMYKPGATHTQENLLSGYFAEGIHSKYLIVADFTLTMTPDFRDYSPYTKYEIYIPFLGYQEIDINLFIGHRVLLFYTTNYDSGESSVFLWDYTNKRLIFSSSVNLSLEIPIDKSNAFDIKTFRNQLIQNHFMNLLQGGFDIIGRGITDEFKTGSGLEIARQFTNVYYGLESKYPSIQASFGEEGGEYYLPLEPKLRITRYITDITDEEMGEYKKLFGRPLGNIRTLSDLSGFTIVSDIHLENLDNALDGEINELYSLLTSGVIL